MKEKRRKKKTGDPVQKKNAETRVTVELIHGTLYQEYYNKECRFELFVQNAEEIHIYIYICLECFLRNLLPISAQTMAVHRQQSLTATIILY